MRVAGNRNDEARPTVEESLRVRLLRLDRERKDAKRARAAEQAEAGRLRIQNRNGDAI